MRRGLRIRILLIIGRVGWWLIRRRMKRTRKPINKHYDYEVK